MVSWAMQWKRVVVVVVVVEAVAVVVVVVVVTVVTVVMQGSELFPYHVAGCCCWRVINIEIRKDALLLQKLRPSGWVELWWR